ncbi:hypothetical protein CYMTET_55005 [Cymbomonas tetramitiformis]|uniref:F-box domain-containing protein n=1 Tax=Cymbomonas tetramitiformis TaxID=36881 RepID=A0AAE0BEW5_9CHLO|nr:hypothetical protein CYMTET_55005 [Cymbomonas tetramitiformis]
MSICFFGQRIRCVRRLASRTSQETRMQNAQYASMHAHYASIREFLGFRTRRPASGYRVFKVEDGWSELRPAVVQAVLTPEGQQSYATWISPNIDLQPDAGSDPLADTAGVKPAKRKRRPAGPGRWSSGKGCELGDLELDLILQKVPPVEQALVCRLVCRRWRAALSEPHVWAPLLTAPAPMHRLTAVHMLRTLDGGRGASHILEVMHLLRDSNRLCAKRSARAVGELRAHVNAELPRAAELAAGITEFVSSTCLRRLAQEAFTGTGTRRTKPLKEREQCTLHGIMQTLIQLGELMVPHFGEVISWLFFLREVSADFMATLVRERGRDTYGVFLRIPDAFRQFAGDALAILQLSAGRLGPHLPVLLDLLSVKPTHEHNQDGGPAWRSFGYPPLADGVLELVVCLASIDDHASVIASRLSSEDPYQKCAALEALRLSGGLLPHSARVAALLEDSNEDVQLYAAAATRSLGPAATVHSDVISRHLASVVQLEEQALEELAEGREAFVWQCRWLKQSPRVPLLHSLASLGPAGAPHLPLLARQLAAIPGFLLTRLACEFDSQHRDIRSVAGLADGAPWGHWRHREVRAMTVRCLKSREQVFRQSPWSDVQQAVCGLREHVAEDQVALVAEWLQHPEEGMRYAGAHTLRILGAPLAVPHAEALLTLMKDPHRDVRDAARGALAALHLGPEFPRAHKLAAALAELLSESALACAVASVDRPYHQQDRLSETAAACVTFLGALGVHAAAHVGSLIRLLAFAKRTLLTMEDAKDDSVLLKPGGDIHTMMQREEIAELLKAVFAVLQTLDAAITPYLPDLMGLLTAKPISPRHQPRSRVLGHSLLEGGLLALMEAMALPKAQLEGVARQLWTPRAPDTLCAVLEMLGRLQALSPHSARVAELLQDESEDVQWYSARALWRLGGAAAPHTDAMAKHLAAVVLRKGRIVETPSQGDSSGGHSADWLLQALAALPQCAAGHLQVIAQQLAYLQGSATAEQHVQAALQQLQGHATEADVSALAGWLSSSSSNFRYAGASALIALGRTHMAPHAVQIMRLQGDSDAYVQGIAFKAGDMVANDVVNGQLKGYQNLGDLSEVLVDHLVGRLRYTGALQSDSKGVMEEALGVLGPLVSQRAVATLFELVQGSIPCHRSAALEAIQKLGANAVLGSPQSGDAGWGAQASSSTKAAAITKLLQSIENSRPSEAQHITLHWLMLGGNPSQTLHEQACWFQAERDRRRDAQRAFMAVAPFLGVDSLCELRQQVQSQKLHAALDLLQARVGSEFCNPVLDAATVRLGLPTGTCESIWSKLEAAASTALRALRKALFPTDAPLPCPLCPRERGLLRTCEMVQGQGSATSADADAPPVYSNHQFEEHLEAVHGQRLPIKCPYCVKGRKRFKGLLDLKRHCKALKHEGTPFEWDGKF